MASAMLYHKRSAEHENDMERQPLSGVVEGSNMHLHISIDRNAVCTVFILCALSTFVFGMYGANMPETWQKALVLTGADRHTAQNPTVTIEDADMKSLWESGANDGVREMSVGKGGREKEEVVGQVNVTSDEKQTAEVAKTTGEEKESEKTSLSNKAVKNEKVTEAEKEEEEESLSEAEEEEFKKIE